MHTSSEEIDQWLDGPEDERLEFKEAKARYDFDKLVKYVVALANEGGGRIVLGVTDRIPRRVVGTRAFSKPERTRAGIFERLRLRADVEEVNHPDGRVVVVHVPPRERGTALHVDGQYLMRAGDQLVPMTDDRLREIFAESGPDFSAEPCRGATLHDLDPEAVEEFRRLWVAHSGNAALANLGSERLLEDAELVVDGEVTYAAFILLGRAEAVSRHLPQAETIFEYRSRESSVSYQQRKEFREGFLLYYEELVETINLRNESQEFVDGLFMRRIPTFSEEVVREGVLNAICHRDYRDGGSIFIRQYPRRLEVESPGGFPAGISEANVLRRQKPRNRRIAEAFAKCGLVERSGQGMDRMFEQSIREGKPVPHFSGTDEYQVLLNLEGQVRDVRFLKLLEEIGQDTLESFAVEDLLVLERVFHEEKLSDELRQRVNRLVDLGVLERVGRGRGVRYLPARKFYRTIGKKAAYTRRKGLDRDTNKALLVQHIRENAREGARLHELRQVLPALSYDQVRRLLQDLKGEGEIRVEGTRRYARWFPVDEPRIL
jgi:ATP-dependent DNA helicase RecG